MIVYNTRVKFKLNNPLIFFAHKKPVEAKKTVYSAQESKMLTWHWDNIFARLPKKYCEDELDFKHHVFQLESSFNRIIDHLNQNQKAELTTLLEQQVIMHQDWVNKYINAIHGDNQNIEQLLENKDNSNSPDPQISGEVKLPDE